MNDIYKQKAEKYKYKYLKLKQDLEGAGSQCKYNLPIIFDKDSLDFPPDKPGKLKIVTKIYKRFNTYFKKFN
jgi:hypothetical protein